MKNTIKRSIALVLSLLTLFAFFAVPTSKVSAATMYNNTVSATLSCDVDSAGCLYSYLSVAGKSGTTRIAVELYVDKQILGLFWSRVNIGYENNVWTDYTTKSCYSNTFSTYLPSHGTFRVTVTYTVSGSGGANDIITKTQTITY
ncbi:MAG: hypothetical protein IKO51_10475 [Clostridia bacterium]|nr:hypothetical protein [Clostridia bacterium]